VVLVTPALTVGHPLPLGMVGQEGVIVLNGLELLRTPPQVLAMPRSSEDLRDSVVDPLWTISPIRPQSQEARTTQCVVRIWTVFAVQRIWRV
jgi:hypothetical protein